MTMETMQPQQATVQTETIIRGQGTKTATRIKDQQETQNGDNSNSSPNQQNNDNQTSDQNNGNQGVNPTLSFFFLF
jgi:hypothetical protein